MRDACLLALCQEIAAWLRAVAMDEDITPAGSGAAAWVATWVYAPRWPR